MNKNYIPAYECCSILPLRARHLLPFASCVNRRLFRSWRFYLSCVIGALLLSATNTLGGTITVTNGNDKDQVPCGKRSLMPRQAMQSISPQALPLLL